MKIDNGFLLISSLTAAIFVGLFFLASPSAGRAPAALGEASRTAKASALTATESPHNFGTLSMAKGQVAHNYKIKNPTSAPVTVERIFTSCMCTEATLVNQGKRTGPFGMPGHGFGANLNEVINAGEEAEVEVVFDPAAHGPAGVGPVTREVSLEQKDAGPLRLSFTAQVTP